MCLKVRQLFACVAHVHSVPPCLPGWIEVYIVTEGLHPCALPQAVPGPHRCSRQMPSTRNPHRKVSQVLLILIGSGMTYCWGEGDCHGPTGMGAEGVQGQRGEEVCVPVCVFVV